LELDYVLVVKLITINSHFKYILIIVIFEVK
jgi:hypothetical protein